MDKRFAVTALAILLTAAGSIVMASRSAAGAEPAAPLQAESGAEDQPFDTDAAREVSGADYLYIIREYDGKVAVFTAADQDVPKVVYDTPVQYLPDYDRARMKEGIPVADYRELLERVEDYIS